MYDNGIISKKEAERVMTFCNNPGSAFVISAVGVSLFGSLKLGIILYVCVILSSVIVGAVGRLFYRGEKYTSCSAATIKASLSATRSCSILIRISATGYIWMSSCPTRSCLPW